MGGGHLQVDTQHDTIACSTHLTLGPPCVSKHLTLVVFLHANTLNYFNYFLFISVNPFMYCLLGLNQIPQSFFKNFSYKLDVKLHIYSQFTYFPLHYGLSLSECPTSLSLIHSTFHLVPNFITFCVLLRPLNPSRYIFTFSWLKNFSRTSLTFTNSWNSSCSLCICLTQKIFT